MRKSFAESLTGVKSLFLFVLAIALLFGASASTAQNLSFVELQTQYYKDGALSGSAIESGAVLVGSDDWRSTSGDQIGGAQKDGDLKTDANAPKYLKNVVGITYPIIANIQSSGGGVVTDGEDYALMAVVEGVTPSIVTDVRGGQSATAIALVSATFDSGLFSSTIGGGTLIKEVSPTSVFAVGADTQGLPASVKVNSTTVLVYVWKNASVLQAENADKTNTANSYKAKVSIVGTTSATDSNFVGYETADSGPIVKTGVLTDGANDAQTIIVRNAELFQNGASLAAPSGKPLATQTEFRTKDRLTIFTQITENPTYDGEPNEYFGSGGSDTLKSLNTSSGSGLATAGKGSFGMSTLYTITVQGGGTAINSASASSGTTVYATQTSGGDIIVSVTGVVRDDAQTTGAKLPLKIEFKIADDIGNASTASSTQFNIDTVDPIVVAMDANTEGSIGSSYSSVYGKGKIGANNPNADSVNFDIQIDPAGEAVDTAANAKAWASVLVSPTQTLNGPNAWTASGAAKIADVTTGIKTNFLALPDTNSSNGIDAVSLSADFTANTNSVTSAAFIVQVSDNARNYAKQTNGATQFITGNSLTFTRKSITTNKIDPVTFTVENSAPVILGATIYASGLPDDFYTSPYNSSDDSSFDKSALFTLFKSIDQTIKAASNAGFVSSGTDVRLVTHFGMRNATRGYKGMKVELEVAFSPDAATTTGNDWRFTGDQSSGDSFFSNIFIGSATTANDTILGSSVPAFVSNPTASQGTASNPWEFISAGFNQETVNKATAIFRLTSGVTSTLAFQQSGGVAGATAFPVVADKNYNISSQSKNTNTFVLDANTPLVGTHNSTISDVTDISLFKDGKGTAISTIYFVTDGALPSSFNIQIDNITQVANSSTAINSASFINYEQTASFKAGYTLILSASFHKTEFAGITPYDDALSTADGSVHFPFLISEVKAANEVLVASTVEVATGDRLVGRKFGTITADFSEVITSAKNILPSASSEAGGDGDLSTSVGGETIYATWAYFVDPSQDLNSSISTSQVRYVTFTSRDLAGNKEIFSFPLGAADFNKPNVSIARWDIARPNNSGGKDAGDVVGTNIGTVASTISAATISKSATSTVVVNFSNGPFKTTEDYVSLLLDDADTTGNANLLTELIQETSVTNDKGGSLIASSTIGVATFVIDWSNYSSKGLSNLEKASAKLVATVTSVTGTVTQAASTNGVQVDGKSPTVVSSLREETVLSGDSGTDIYVRPNRNLILDVTVTTDTYEQSPSVAINSFDASVDFGNFKSTYAADVKTLTPATLGSANNQYKYTYTFVVPNNNGVTAAKGVVKVTDQAGNVSTDSNAQVNGQNVRIETAVPTLDIVRLNATADYIRTGTAITTKTPIATTQINNVTTTFSGKGGAIIGAGDSIEYGLEITPNDPVFNDVANFTITADFSSIGLGSAVSPNTTQNFLSKLYATWSVTVPATATSIVDASFPVSVKDPATFSGTGISDFPTINVDTQAIPGDISLTKLEYWQNGVNKGTSPSALNPNNSATATVVIKAVFDDPTSASTLFKDQTVASHFNQATPNNATEAAEVVGLNYSDFNSTSSITKFNAGNFSPPVGGSFSFSVVADAADNATTVTDANFGTDATIAPTRVTASTAYILTATWDNITINKSISSAEFVVSVSDTAGNAKTKNLGSVLLDGEKPTISITDLKVNSGSYLPAVKNASGTIIAPTRVKSGALMQITLDVDDNPNDDIEGVLLKLDEFISSGAEQLIAGVTQSKTGVTDTFTVGSVNTYSLSSGDVANIKSGTKSYDDPVFYTVGSASSANVVVNVTDTVGNIGTGTSTQLIEVDNTGPMLIDSRIFTVTNDLGLSAIQSLTPESALLKPFNANGSFLQLGRSSWLVFAGTFVVDGSSSSHFGAITSNVNASPFIPDTIERFDASTISQGSTVLAGANSATRALRFATYAIQVKESAPPILPNNVTFTFVDALSNTSKRDDALIGIDASGPRANEISLFVNGQKDSIDNFANVGIGNTGPDLGTGASFEFKPGDAVVIVATMSTNNGGFPDIVYADLRAFYPPELATEVDEVLPSSLTLDDENDLVVAEWRYVTYDFSNLVSDTASAAVRSNYQAFADFDLKDVNTKTDSSALPQNAVLSGATPSVPSEWVTESWPSGFVGSPTTIATNLAGLPGIWIQKDPKIADDVASITITVDVNSDNFSSSAVASTKFAVDTKRPGQAISMDPTKIVRNISAKVTDQSTTNGRFGYPLAQSQSKSVTDRPNRVRGGDVVPFVFNVTNEAISGTKDDKYRMLPGSTFDPSKVFDISDSSVANTIVVLTADVSSFATGQTNLQAGLDSSVAAYTASLVPDASKNAIKAQFDITVSDNSTGLGTTGTESRTAKSVTATVRDDAGNLPYDGYYTDSAKRTTASLTSADKVKRQSFQPLAVDNRPPTVSGELKVRLNSGSATKPNNDPVAIGELVPNDSKISPSAVLGVSATVIDTVDNPLDILNNINFGDPKMSGVNLADATIKLITQGVGLVGTDTIDVPFEVTLPAVGGGISSKNFFFTVSASDTIGNSQTIVTQNRFQFDGDPALSMVVDNSVLGSGAVVTANASATTVISASAFDVGGVTAIEWKTVPSIVGATITTTAPVLAGTFGSVDLVIIPEVTTSLTGQVVAVAGVTDISNNYKELAVTIDFNQPAIFAESFSGSLTSSAGDALPPVTLNSSVEGYTPAAGLDVRSVTVTEGESLVLDLTATDADGDAVVFAATGTAISANVFANSVVNGTQFTFAPGYKAVTGATETSSNYSLDLTATDNKTAADISALNVNVVAQSATPTFSVESIKLTKSGSSTPTSLDPVNTLQVDMNEEDTIQIVVKGVDAGDETLEFMLTQQQQVGPIPSDNIVVSGTSILYATITYTPNLSQADVITLIMSAKNSTIESNKSIRVLNIANVSQAPIVTAQVSVGGAAAEAILADGSVTASPNTVVNFTFDVDDPDNDAIRIPTATATGASVGSTNAPGVATPIADDHFTLAFSVTVASDAAPGSQIQVIASATDTSLPTNKSRSVSFFINVPTGPVPVAAPYDEIIVAQGPDGQTNVNIRNMDPNVDANNDSLTDSNDITAILGSYNAMPQAFEANVGGGTNRAVNFAVGDITNDGKTELITTFGPVSRAANANSANMVVVRSGTGTVPVPPIGNIFPDQAGSDARILYPTGELTAAVGDFVGSGTKQIAFVQGTGGTGALRVFEWNGGLDFANGPANYDIKAQLANQDELDADSGNVMTDDLVTSNNGAGFSIAAYDFDGNGKDEIIVGQQGPLGMIQVVKLGAPNAAVSNIVLDASYSAAINVFNGFETTLRGDRGVNLAVSDLNGDGTPEVIITSRGDSTGASTIKNWILITTPIMSGSDVTGLQILGNGIQNAFSQPEGANPSSGLNIGVGEFSGFSSDGQALIVGSKAIVDYTGFTKTVSMAAPQSLYTVLKVNFNEDGSISGTSNMIIPGRAEGFSAFQGDFNMASGEVTVAGYNTNQ